MRKLEVESWTRGQGSASGQGQDEGGHHHPEDVSDVFLLHIHSLPQIILTHSFMLNIQNLGLPWLSSG